MARSPESTAAVSDPLVVIVDAIAAERIAYAGAFATLSVAVEAPLAAVPTSVPDACDHASPRPSP